MISFGKNFQITDIGIPVAPRASIRARQYHKFNNLKEPKELKEALALTRYEFFAFFEVKESYSTMFKYGQARICVEGRMFRDWHPRFVRLPSLFFLRAFRAFVVHNF